jgi:ABC-type nitrate/sulfonate/bicarbonate transport system substrate-binding protein
MRNFLTEHSGAFDPDEVRTLVAAFDKAWEAVQASGVVYPEAKAQIVRAILATHIIAAAKNGERDHGRLRDGALLALAQANLRTSDRPPR